MGLSIAISLVRSLWYDFYGVTSLVRRLSLQNPSANLMAYRAFFAEKLQFF
jgi:hypothetical protein